MSEILFYYRRPDPTTWVYMSSLLTFGLFFVFHRFWSVRNLDIALLILLAPGLLMVHEGRRRELREIEQIAKHHADELIGRSNSHSQRGILVSQVDPEETGFDELAGGNVLEPSDESASGTSVPLSTDDDLEIPLPNTSSKFTPQDMQRGGFIFLFVIQGLILVRLFLDPLMSRRPLLDPNLTTGGLYFISISLFLFMMGNVVTSTPRIQVLQGPKLGPGYALMHKMPTITTRPVSEGLAGADPTVSELSPSEQRWTMFAKVLAILAHLAIVSGIILIGNRHFGNLRAGVGAATLYLMLPYTAQMTGRVDHAIPAALLLWAILMYRRPMPAGILFGLAAGLVYYPLFLLPLWCSFYWRRGVRRFVVGVAATLAILMLLLSLAGTESLIDHLRLMFGIRAPIKNPADLQGIWALGWNPIWRLPVIVGFVIISVFFASWPSPKNLGTLISCSAAVMVAAQFWHGYGGGLYIGWFLPLLLLTIFRPNLQDRVALKVVQVSKREHRQPTLEAQSA